MGSFLISILSLLSWISSLCILFSWICFICSGRFMIEIFLFVFMVFFSCRWRKWGLMIGRSWGRCGCSIWVGIVLRFLLRFWVLWMILSWGFWELVIGVLLFFSFGVVVFIWCFYWCGRVMILVGISICLFFLGFFLLYYELRWDYSF